MAEKRELSEKPLCQEPPRTRLRIVGEIKDWLYISLERSYLLMFLIWNYNLFFDIWIGAYLEMLDHN